VDCGANTPSNHCLAQARIRPAFTILPVAFLSEAPRSGMETLDFGYLA